MPLLCCTIVFAAVGCAGVGPQPTDPLITEQIAANQELAVDIINALAEYHESAGSFPGDLEDLVPAYLSAVPETVTGESFAYYPDDLGSYSLCFYLGGHLDRGCCFHQGVCLWECSNP